MFGSEPTFHPLLNNLIECGGILSNALVDATDDDHVFFLTPVNYSRDIRRTIKWGNLLVIYLHWQLRARILVDGFPGLVTHASFDLSKQSCPD